MSALISLISRTATKGLTGMMSAPIVSKAIKPIARRLVPEIPNNMPGFYGGGMLQAAGAALPKAVKGVVKGINRELNPTKIKQNKLFHKDGITTETQDVANREVKFLETPEVTSVLERRANKEKLTEADMKLIKKINTTGKVMEGQLEWNTLVAKQYGMKTKLFDDTILKDNYYGQPLPATPENMSKGLGLHKPWVADEYMTPGIDAQIQNHIREVQGISGKSDDDILMFIKKPNSSNAAGNLIANVNKKAKNRKIAKAVIRKRGKPFDSVSDLQKALEKAGVKSRADEKEGVVYFQDSFSTSSYSLGGANNHSFMFKDGVVGSNISDINDIFKIDMPGGKTGLTITPTYYENMLAIKGVSKAKFKKKNKQKLTKKEEVLLKKEKKLEDEWRTKNQSELKDDAGISSAMRTAGLNKRQVFLIKKIIESGASPLEVKDYIKYLAKVGTVGAGAASVLASPE